MNIKLSLSTFFLSLFLPSFYTPLSLDYFGFRHFQFHQLLCCAKRANAAKLKQQQQQQQYPTDYRYIKDKSRNGWGRNMVAVELYRFTIEMIRNHIDWMNWTIAERGKICYLDKVSKLTVEHKNDEEKRSSLSFFAVCIILEKTSPPSLPPFHKRNAFGKIS